MGTPDCFQIICGVKYLKKKGMNDQEAYSKGVCFKVISQA